jgi:hypothetical protein
MGVEDPSGLKSNCILAPVAGMVIRVCRPRRRLETATSYHRLKMVAPPQLGAEQSISIYLFIDCLPAAHADS